MVCPGYVRSVFLDIFGLKTATLLSRFRRRQCKQKKSHLLTYLSYFLRQCKTQTNFETSKPLGLSWADTSFGLFWGRKGSDFIS